MAAVCSPYWVRASTLVAPGSTGGASTGSAMMRLPSRKRRMSARRSWALGYRLAGFFARHLSVMASSVSGRAGSNRRGGIGFSCTCLYAMATALSPANGGWPVVISYSTQPRL